MRCGGVSYKRSLAAAIGYLELHSLPWCKAVISCNLLVFLLAEIAREPIVEIIFRAANLDQPIFGVLNH